MTDPRIAVIERPVVMADVDLVQAHFAAYFRWMDAGYHALLAQLGHPLSSILAAGFGTPVVDARCSYLAPIGVDDVLVLRTAVTATGNASYTVEAHMAVGETAVARAATTHVWIELAPTKHAAPLPPWLRDARVEEL